MAGDSGAGAPNAPDERVGNRRKRSVFWLANVALMVVLLLAALEIASRIVLEEQTFGTGSSELTYDPELGWRAKRLFEGDVHHGKYPVPVPVRINGDGFRDDDWDGKLRRAAATGAKKIALVGDSLVYGYASHKDQRLGEQLAEVYRMAQKQVEVFSAGIPAFGAAQQYRMLPELLARVHPDAVVLLFYENDYGDTALPYDHRHPFRVYKPFYDERGEILFNEKVPKRPSLAVANTPLAGPHLWFALDQAYYFFQDLRYKAHDIPNRGNTPYAFEWYDFFIFEEWLKERYPYVEKTVMVLYEKMADLCREAGAGFVIAASRERVHYVIADKLAQRGIDFVPAPPEQVHYWRWEETLYDNHPNFLWAWLVANKIYEALEGRPYAANLDRMPQLSQIPSEIDFGNDPQSARYLFGDWRPAEGNGRWLGREGRFLLRAPGPAGTETVLEITALVDKQEVLIEDDRGRLLCTLAPSPSKQTFSCLAEVEPGHRLLFVQASCPTADAPEDEAADAGGVEGCAWFERATVRPAS